MLADKHILVFLSLSVNIGRHNSTGFCYYLHSRYMVISGHTAEDCRQAVKYFAEFHAGYITHFEWGCKDYDHNAYAIIEAD